MKRRIVSLLLAGCMIAKVGAVAFAEEMPEIQTIESTNETAEPTVTENVETNDVVTETPVTESYDTTIPEVEPKESETSDESTVDTDISVTDDESKKDVVEDEPSLEKDETSIEPSEGDTRFEIITNEDGTQKKIVYEYVVDEETGELIEVIKEEIEGKFDENGELIEDVEEDDDENLGKIIGFEALEDISFDHVPTMDELKDSLPKSVAATIKGKEDDTKQDVEIKFNESSLEEIVIENADNEEEESRTYNLEAEVVTDIEIADGVSLPNLTITVLDQGIDYEYQELTDETTGVCVKGVFPKNASIEVTMSEISQTISNRMKALDDAYDMNLDSCDTEFVDSCYQINILDKDGNVYDMAASDKQAHVIIPLQDDSASKIAGNRFTVFVGEGETDHKFDKDANTIEYLSNDFAAPVTVLGTQTHYFYNVRFEVLSTTEEDFEFSSEYRAEKGSELTVPTFYSSDYPKLESLTWSDVDATVECDMLYTNYIDSTKYVADKGDVLEDSIVESYGDDIVVEGEENIDDESIVSKEDDASVIDDAAATQPGETEKSNSDEVTDVEVTEPVKKVDDDASDTNSEQEHDNKSTDDVEVVVKEDIIVPEVSESNDDTSSEE